jgi:hypothetical protein
MFERNDTDAETITRIFLNDQPSIAFTNGSQLSMGNYTRLTGIHDNVQDNQSSPQELVTVNATYVSAFSINYSILRDTASRVGTITVSTNVGGSALNYSDDFVQNQDTGVTLTITQVGSTVSLNYTSLSTGQSGIINFSINYLV